jgi:hypothetical protein
MQRLWARDREEQIAYHLRDGRAPEFDKGQPGRIDLARFLVDKILKKELTERPLTFVELGCGAGDITGPYSDTINVIGYDVTPAAQEACNRRWPDMTFHLKPVEEVEPYECDLLVLCEVLEHLDDPVSLVRAWLPKARWVIIGHPLNEPNPPFEHGHIWSYTREDWYDWFRMGGHYPWERLEFSMGVYDTMVIGHGCRTDQPAYTG